MQFWLTILALLKRSQVMIPAILIAAVLSGTAFLVTPVSFVSSATMVLTTTQFGGSESRDPTRPTDLTNPMLNFNESLTTTSAILIQAMNTKAVANQLGATGKADIVVDDGRSNPDLLGLNGPFIFIVGRSTSPEQARQLVDDAQDLMRAKLLEWQDVLDAPKKTYIGLVDVVSPTPPAADRSQAVEYALLAFVVGLLGSLGFAYFRHQKGVRRSALDVSWSPSQDVAHSSLDRQAELTDWESSPAPVLVPHQGQDGAVSDVVLPVPARKAWSRGR